jgi:hypothetical protein
MNRFHRLVVNQPNELPWFYLSMATVTVLVMAVVLSLI